MKNVNGNVKFGMNCRAYASHGNFKLKREGGLHPLVICLVLRTLPWTKT